MTLIRRTLYCTTYIHPRSPSSQPSVHHQLAVHRPFCTGGWGRKVCFSYYWCIQGVWPSITFRRSFSSRRGKPTRRRIACQPDGELHAGWLRVIPQHAVESPATTHLPMMTREKVVKPNIESQGCPSPPPPKLLKRKEEEKTPSARGGAERSSCQEERSRWLCSWTDRLAVPPSPPPAEPTPRAGAAAARLTSYLSGPRTRTCTCMYMYTHCIRIYM